MVCVNDKRKKSVGPSENSVTSVSLPSNFQLTPFFELCTVYLLFIQVSGFQQDNSMLCLTLSDCVHIWWHATHPIYEETKEETFPL